MYVWKLVEQLGIGRKVSIAGPGVEVCNFDIDYLHLTGATESQNWLVDIDVEEKPVHELNPEFPLVNGSPDEVFRFDVDGV